MELTTLVNVALRKESVDRNCTAAGAVCVGLVALRKESVDRNRKYLFLEAVSMVALRKESVDRNVPSAAYDGDI